MTITYAGIKIVNNLLQGKKIIYTGDLNDS